MRVISGSLKGRKLKFKGERIRPTSERVRESVFNILGMGLDELAVLDLYAGTGAMGIEALSRGAHRAVFVDASREAARLIKDNLKSVQVMDRAILMTKKAGPAIKLLAADGERFDLVFMDPPYGAGETERLLNLLAELDVLKEGAVVVAEHGSGEKIEDEYGSLARTDARVYGGTAVSFFERGGRDEG